MKNIFIKPLTILTLLAISPHICAAQEQEHALQVCEMPELVSYIQSFLGHADLARSAQVNRLWRAQAEHEQNKRVKPLIAQHGNAQDAFMHAAKNNLIWAIHPLIKKFNADVNHAYTDENRTAALIAATRRNRTAMVKTLLVAGADVNHADQDGDTALICAKKNGNPRIAQLLLAAQGIDNNNAHNHLLSEAQAGNTPRVKALLLAHPNINTNHSNGHGNTALTLASRRGRTKIVQMLLAHPNTNINQLNHHGKTALIEAVEWNQDETVRELLKHNNTDTNYANKNGNTALILAAQNGNTAIAKMLIAAGTNINHKNKLGKDALRQALINRHNAISLALIITPTLNADYANHFLLEASWKGNTDITQKLITNPNININHQDANGSTALIGAAHHGHTQTVQALIAAGADINLADPNGHTPLMHATSKNHTAIAQLLLDAGARDHQTPPDNRHEVHNARQQENAGCIIL
jgi:ankyrin repeat protein